MTGVPLPYVENDFTVGVREVSQSLGMFAGLSGLVKSGVAICTSAGKKILSLAEVLVGTGRAADEAATAAQAAAAARAAAEANKTVEQQILEAARRATVTVGQGRGPVYGSYVHRAFAAEVKALGTPNLRAEVSYLNREVVPWGTPGSVRLDAVAGPIACPTVIYDLKTGCATLTPARVQEIWYHVPGGSSVPIIVVRP